VSESARAPSARRDELLERAYRYVLEHGLADMSLRPLAAAVGSSPRVLLFLFGTKDDLIRALLSRARADELAVLDRARQDGAGDDLASALRATWRWLVAEPRRPLLTLWLEAYARSLVQPHGPSADFARQTVDDWLAVLAGAQAAPWRCSDEGIAERTLALSVLRGALLDLLATGDIERTTAAVEQYLHLLARKTRS
jgi:AcrR family transcriptional regulator